MFNFRKFKFPSRLRAWGSRGQIQPGSLHVMDPEAGRGVGYERDPSPKRVPFREKTRAWMWTLGRVGSEESASSQSEPILPGPSSNPEDFRLVVNATGGAQNCESVRKTVSLGAVAVVPRSGKVNPFLAQDRTGNLGNGETIGGRESVSVKVAEGNCEPGDGVPLGHRGAHRDHQMQQRDEENQRESAQNDAQISVGTQTEDWEHGGVLCVRCGANAVIGMEGGQDAVREEPRPRSTGTNGDDVALNNLIRTNQQLNGGHEMVPLGEAGDDIVAMAVNREDNPLYLHAYLETLYFFGVSPYRTPAMRVGQDNTWIPWLLRVFQLAVFSGIVFWSVWESFNLAKLSLLWFMLGDGLGLFLGLAFHLTCILTKLYSAYLFTAREDDVDSMLTQMEEYGNQYGSKSPCHCNHWKWIILGICIGTVVFSVTDTLFDNGFEEWTPEAMLVEKSYDVSIHMFLWTHNNMSDRAHALVPEYGRTLTRWTMVFGLMGTAQGISSNYQMGTLRDTVLVIVFIIFVLVTNFMTGVKETLDNIDEEVDPQGHQALQQQRERVWGQFQLLKGVMTATNLVLDVLLLFLHVDNMFLYGFFAGLCIEKNDTAAVTYAHYAFNILKAELTYLLAARISAHNEILRQWIQNWGLHDGYIMVGTKKHDVGVLLDQLTTKPMGIGTGIFHIDTAFHCRFLMMASSLVLFLAEQKKKAAQFR